MARRAVPVTVRTALGALLAALLLAPATAVGASAPAAAAGDDGAPVGGEALGARGVVLDAGPGAPKLPTVKAKAWLVADADSGEVLAARSPHVAHRPASTLKILTALATLPLLPPDAEYEARPQDARAIGSRVGLVPGQTYTAEQLFQGLLMVSGNDAARAVAHAAGGRKATVRRMNDLATELQAGDTHAVNPSGLDAPGQFSSAYDLALLGRAALEDPRLTKYATTVKADFPGKPRKKGKGRKSYEIWTLNRLLYNYDGAVGVKTGWTSKARGTYVGAARRDGRTLVVSVLHTDRDSWQESARLLDWGFAADGAVTPVGTLVGPADESTDDASPGEDAQGATSGETAAAAPLDEGSSSPPWAAVGLVSAGALALALGVVLLRVRAGAGPGARGGPGRRSPASRRRGRSVSRARSGRATTGRR